MTIKYKILTTLVLSVFAFGVSTADTEAQTAPSPLIPNFQRSWGALDKWYEYFPTRETYHAANPWADPDSIKDGWWADRNFADWLPVVSSTVKWKPDYRFDGKKHDFGFTQAERFLAKWQNAGSIKFLADASGRPVQKRVYTEVIVPADGVYTFESWAWYSKYNGDINNVHLAMEIGVNGSQIAEPVVKCPNPVTGSTITCKDQWLPLVARVLLNKNDKVKVTFIADQKNDTNQGLADFYFTIPEGGTGKL